MSSEEYKLARTLVWSQQDFTLKEFVEEYQLPQVVSVEVGYCGTNERTSFSSGQILTLHTVQTTNKIVCKLLNGKSILVPSGCELKAEVIPMDCSDTIVTAYKLLNIYKKVKYIRVMEIGSAENNNRSERFLVNDILQIKKRNTTDNIIQCKNVSSGQIVSISGDCTTVFVPLEDPETYTFAEIQKNFKLPAKVRFLDKKAEMKMRFVPGRAQKSSPFLSNQDQMTAIEEIQDRDVIVTTVCSNVKEQVCLPVPITLDIRIAVAEGFLRGDETYQKVVRTLDKQLNCTNLKAFEEISIYEHVKTVGDINNDAADIEEASSEVVERAQKKLNSIERKESRRLFKFEKKPPPLAPRRQNSGGPKAPPPRPPKPGEKPAQTSRNPSNLLKKLKVKSPEWLSSLGRNKNPSEKSFDNESSSSDNEYDYPVDSSGYVYAKVDEIYEGVDESDSDEDQSEYTELDTTYTPSQKPYQKILKRRGDGPSSIQDLPLPPPPKPTTKPPPHTTNQPPPIPSTGPPKHKEDRQAIYEAISRYPKDLSGLTVTDVSKLLQYLNLGAYVETFEKELVDGMMLSSMDEASLKSLNLNTFHSRKLLDFIGGWRPMV